jgi:hypothetical protein
MTSGTLVDITPVKATIKVISEVDATLIDRTLPIGPAVKPYAEGLKTTIGKEVAYSIKKDLKNEEYYSFIKAAEAPAAPVTTGPDKRKKGLLMSADMSGFSIQFQGKLCRYAAGGQNKHIVDRAEEFNKFPLWVMFNYDGSGFLTRDSDIIGVPTKEEIEVELAASKEEQKVKEQNPAPGPQPAHIKCQVCEAELTDAELKKSQLFFSKALCKKCFTEAEEVLGGKKLSDRAPLPAEKPAESTPDKEKPVSVKEGIAPTEPDKQATITTQEDRKEQPARPLTPPPASRISLSVTVSLGNFESLKIGVEGDAADRDQLRALLDGELAQYGRTNELAKTAIDSYRKRVLGGAV